MAETWRVKERIEPGEAMANAGASEGTEVYRAAAGFTDGTTAGSGTCASSVTAGNVSKTRITTAPFDLALI